LVYLDRVPTKSGQVEVSRGINSRLIFDKFRFLSPILSIISMMVEMKKYVKFSG